MSVRYGFMIEIYGFTHSSHILQHRSPRPLFFTLALVMEDSLEDRRRWQAMRTNAEHRRRLSVNRGMKDGSTKVKGEDLRANTMTHFA